MKTIYFQMAFKSFEVKDDVIHIEGYASTNDVDRYNDIVDAKAWDDEEATKAFSDNPILLLQHKGDKALGVVTSWSNDEKGLYVKAEVRNDIDGVKKNIIDGTTKAFSIGFMPMETEYKTRDGRSIDELSAEEIETLEAKDVMRIVSKLQLAEISVVNVPANPATLFTLSKSLKEYFGEFDKKELLTKSLEDEVVDEDEDEREEEAVETTEEVVEAEDNSDEEVEEQAVETTASDAQEDSQEDDTTADEEPAVAQEDQKSLEAETKQLEDVESLLQKRASELETLEAKLAEVQEKLRTTPVAMARAGVSVKTSVSKPQTISSFFNPKVQK